MTGARAKAGGLKKRKEARMAEAESMEGKSSRRRNQSGARTGRAAEAFIRTGVFWFFVFLFLLRVRQAAWGGFE